MQISKQREKFEAAEKLLKTDITSIAKFDSIRILLKGVNPKIDNLLESCSKTFASFKKFQNAQIVELTTENLPENTEEEKQRKKRLLLFLKYWKELNSEVKRAKAELEKTDNQGKIKSSTNIVAYAKGPFGIITLTAVLIAGFLLYQTKNNPKGKELLSPTPIVSEKPKIKVIEFQGKRIPLTEFTLRTGPDCDSPHYHAANYVSVKALDGSIIPDPGACAFGRVKDVIIKEVNSF